MSDAPAERSAVTSLVHTDIVDAERRACGIGDPWYRAQALAWVARYAPDADVERVARLSLEAAAECDDAYRQTAAAAWVVRALLERGRRDEALLMLEIALHGVPRITPIEPGAAITPIRN